MEDWICQPNRVDNSGRSLFVILPSAQSFRYEPGGPSHTQTHAHAHKLTPDIREQYLRAYLQGLQQNLAEAQRSINAGDEVVGSPLLNTLQRDPTTMLSLPTDCPTNRSSFWTLPENMTVERFSQLVGQSARHSSLGLLTTFLQKVLLLLLYPVGTLVAGCITDH